MHLPPNYVTLITNKNSSILLYCNKILQLYKIESLAEYRLYLDQKIVSANNDYSRSLLSQKLRLHFKVCFFSAVGSSDTFSLKDLEQLCNRLWPQGKTRVV